MKVPHMAFVSDARNASRDSWLSFWAPARPMNAGRSAQWTKVLFSKHRLGQASHPMQAQPEVSARGLPSSNADKRKRKVHQATDVYLKRRFTGSKALSPTTCPYSKHMHAIPLPCV
jgi:hypothetical protein